jgi:succinate dehydrogenase / fumarate reductase, cytochrome b subunit
MNAVFALYRSTIGKKVAMAISGLVYIGWVLFHMAGNMQFHLGAEAFNEYAHKLQSMPALVWSGRTFLLAALLVHVLSAFALIAHNNKARGTSYQGGRKPQAATAASRSMRFGGIALLLFIVWHLIDFTVRQYVPFPIHELVGPLNLYDQASVGFVRGEVYHTMLMSFGNPFSAAIYIAAVVFLSLHLYHGAWSVVQTLGFESASTTRLYRNAAAFVAGLVLVGNLSFPIAGLVGTATGLLEGETLTGHCGYYDTCPAGVPARTADAH